MGIAGDKVGDSDINVTLDVSGDVDGDSDGDTDGFSVPHRGSSGHVTADAKLQYPFHYDEIKLMLDAKKNDNGRIKFRHT